MIVETSISALQAGQQVSLGPGDTLRVIVGFSAVAPALTTTELWVSLVINPGRDYTIMKPVTLAESNTPIAHSEVVDLPITDGIGLKNYTYDLWAEMPSYPNAIVKIPNAIVLTGMGDDTAEYVLIKDVTYPLAATYRQTQNAWAEESTARYKVATPNFMMSSTQIDKMVTNLETEFAKEDIHMLSLQLYEKSGPVFSSYMADITTTLPTPTQSLVASGATAQAWQVIFIAVVVAACLIAGIIIYAMVRTDVRQFLYGPEGAGGGFLDTIGILITMVIVMMMMEMMIGLMKTMEAPEGTTPQLPPTPVTDTVERGGRAALGYAEKGIKTAAPYVKEGVKKAVPYIGKGIKKVTEYFDDR